MEGEATGVGRFVSGLLDGLAETDFDHELKLFFQGAPFDHPLWADPRFEPRFSGRSGSPARWEQRLLPRQLEGLDLFFGPAYSLPPRLPCPGVVMIHDLSFEVLPEEFRFRERWRRRWLARRAAKRAARVLTVGHHVAKDLEIRYGVDPGRLGVIHHGVDGDRFRPEAATAAGEHAPTDPYLLYVGALLPRRHPALMLDAYAAVARRRPDLRFVLVGPDRLAPGTMDRLVAERGLGERVLRPGWIGDDDLPSLLAGAEASLYLSSYEGFGIPPMESLACGTLPVVSTGLALDELWPDYPFRCLPLDEHEVVRHLETVLTASPETEAAVAAGRALVRDLTWRRCAEAFLEQIAAVEAG